MKRVYLLLLSLIAAYTAVAQPKNDDCSGATALPVVKDYCSGDGAYSTAGATESLVGNGADVWFKVVAQAYNLHITVGGKNAGGTLTSPKIRFFADCSGTGILGVNASSGDLATMDLSGLIIGRTYYIAISGSNGGTFKLCTRFDTPILQPGSDCGTASFLCNKQGFVQGALSGPGADPNEGRGTCLDVSGTNSENNSAWYKWRAANNGTLVFTLAPTYRSPGGEWDDIDWVLYDLGTTGDCSNLASKAIRCAAGHGVNNSQCPTEPLYYKTGLSFAASDISEASGCGQRQDGVVKFVDMQQDHVYALLVNNFTPGANGFSLDFTDQSGVTGTGEFVGPKADIIFQADNPCVADQTFTFSTQATGAATLKWRFGDDGDFVILNNPPSASGPYTIRYNTLGNKTVALEAANTTGCQVVNIKNFNVGVTPLTPVITSSKDPLCTGDTLVLAATNLPDATYAWTGPDGFTADGQTIRIPIISAAQAGRYTVVITQYDCSSQPGSIDINSIIATPKASFTTNPSLPAKLSYPVTVSFTDRSVNATSWLWDFGDGTTSTDQNPQHEYLTKGDYDVTLLVYNQNACSASVQKGKFVIREFNSLFVPNTFTPNGDGVNDEFVVTITNMTNYHLHIYNRWGQELFETINIFDNWNGRWAGKDVPVGTYYYLITATDANRKPVKKSGSVTVLR